MSLIKCLVALVVFNNSDSLEEAVRKIPQNCGLIIVHNDQPYQEDSVNSILAGREITNIYNGNQGMLAGAYNRIIFNIEMTSNYSHLILLDQDSDTSQMEKFIAGYAGNFDLDHDRTICAPLYVDRGTMRGVRVVRFNKIGFRIIDLNKNDSRYVHCSCIINSMAIIPIQLARRIGGWDEKIGLDHIDTDFCLKALKNKCSLIYDTKSSFLHSIGDRKMVSFLGFSIQSTFHSDFRVGLIFMNSATLFKRYLFSRFMLNFIPLLIFRMLYDLLGIILIEKSPSKFFISCKMFVKGLFR